HNPAPPPPTQPPPPPPWPTALGGGPRVWGAPPRGGRFNVRYSLVFCAARRRARISSNFEPAVA
ncbi:MAG: hypothetical protein F4X16_12280, partial [Caldilineaceae bacterium SB0661_bin_34]|nr:hypothetical protein [Caldilineaceae bacterium SB0661_bin_34]